MAYHELFKLIVTALMAPFLLIGLTSQTVAAQDDKSRIFIFVDEFNKAELNRKFWNVEGPDFWVNNEQQAYVDSPETIRLLPESAIEGSEGGVLELRALYRPVTDIPKDQKGRVADFVSGRISTRDNFGFTYGRVEARIRMPEAEGVWPAFWMLGSGRWPDTGEIDIMEYVGEPDWIGVALHGPGYSGETPIVNKYFFPSKTDVTDWHVYAVEWDREQIIFFVDDRLIYRVTRPMVEHYGKWRFDTPKYIIFNLALGGAYPFKTNGIDEPYNGLPASTVEQLQNGGLAIQVDWVRVSQHVNSN